MLKAKYLIASVVFTAVLLTTIGLVLAAPGDVVLTSPAASQAGAAGDTLTYTVNVANTTDYSTDITLTVTSAVAWATTPAPLTVAGNATETVEIVVTIPSTATNGSYTFAVGAAGVQSPNGTALLPGDVTPLTLTTQIGGYSIFLPVIMKNTP